MRYWPLLLLMLLVACGSPEVQVNQSVDEINDSGESNETVEQPVQNEPEHEPEPEISDTELLEQLEDRQSEVYAQRADVLVKKRDVYDKLLDDELPFEDRQFYQRAVDILKERQDQLTLEATLLESRIRTVEKRVEAAEYLEVYTRDLEDLRDEEDDLMEELRDVVPRVNELREEWLESFNESEELVELEAEEAELRNELSEVRNDIDELERKIGEIEEPPEDYADLLVRRQAVSEELNIVRSELVDAYLDSQEDMEHEIDELEEREDRLEDELRDIDEELN